MDVMNRSLPIGILVAIAAALSGCSRGYNANVNGSVLLEGEPVTSGVVTFHAVQGGPLSLGTLDNAGRYDIFTGRDDGLPSGDYVVTVNSVKGAPSPGMTPAQMEALRITPARYSNRDSSELRFTVEPGSNIYNIALTRSVD